MTIHRDVKHPIHDGFVVKTFGGISLSKSPTTPISSSNVACTICNRTVNDRFAYQLFLTDNRTEKLCCAHCGLMRQLQLGEQVSQAMTYDFFTGTMMGANIAHFVIDPAIRITCCQPQVLAFDLKENAERFIQGFGGHTYQLQEALQFMEDELKC